MRNVIIWGAGDGYERIINLIQFEILKGNMQVLALVIRPEDFVGEKVDGFKVILKEDIWDYEFDYLIVTSPKWYKEIRDEAISMGVPEKSIINANIFLFHLFDFERYVRLIENPITIFSNMCWGGKIYHRLNLKFTSPLINTFVPMDSYIKLIENPQYYFEQPLICTREGDIRKNLFPIGTLGESDKEIQIYFPHERSFADAKIQWDKRCARVNYDNIFVAMLFDASEDKSEEYLKAFDKIKTNKICFYSGKTDIESVVYLKRFEWFINHADRAKRTYSYQKAIFLLMDGLLFKSIDILKLLNWEKDYIREQ